MEKTTSQKALKVLSIIMIVFAALAILMSLAAIIGGGAIGVMGAGSAEGSSAALVGGFAMILGFVLLFAACFDLVVGIFGVRGANNPSKIGVFFVLAIIDLIISVISALMTFFGGSADMTEIISTIVGVIIPCVFVLLANNIKKENALR